MSDQIEAVYQRAVQRPADHIIYKGKAALQVSLKPATPTSSGNYVGSKKGVIFMKVAPCVGDKRYDWEHQGVTISISEHEVGQLIVALRGKETVKFYHDKFKGSSREGEEIKQMTVGESGGTVFVNMLETKNGESRKIPGVPISHPEAIVLAELLKAALPKVLGWT